jgi:hypothetical protein
MPVNSKVKYINLFIENFQKMLHVEEIIFLKT